MSSALLGWPPLAGPNASPPAALAPSGPPNVRFGGEMERSGTVTVIAGVGVLLLAMGVAC
jgi:hypothetical protein